jgi:hypothetical protein
MAEELDELVEGWKPTKSINTPTSLPIEKNRIVQVLNAEELNELVEGLESNQINQYTHILTGYIGSKSFLLQLADVVKRLKAANPGEKVCFFLKYKIFVVFLTSQNLLRTVCLVRCS